MRLPAGSPSLSETQTYSSTVYLEIDSKTLASSTRETLLTALSSDSSNLGWSVRVIRLVVGLLPKSGVF